MFCDFDLDDLFYNLFLLFICLCFIFFVILPLFDIEVGYDYDSVVTATVINVELEGENPDRLVSYEYEIDGEIYRDIDDVSVKSYYAIGDVITIEYLSDDITKTRIVTEE